VKCSTAEFSGNNNEEQTGETLTSFATYDNCTVFGLSGSTVNMNGCHYRFHTGTKVVTETKTDYNATVDVVCPGPEAGPIIVTAKVGTTVKCTVTIPAQSGLEGVSFENEGEGAGRAVVVNSNVTGIEYTQHEGSGFGRCSNANHTGEGNGNGKYTGSVTVGGENAAGEPVGVWVE
jgi:hypothetical protein